MSFETAYLPMMKIEHGYSKRKNDRGGETWNGVARNRHPNLRLWNIIDRYKSHPNFPKCLKRDEELSRQVMEFYRHKFWIAPDLDEIDDINEFLAEKMFRLCVNFGPSRPCKWLQRAMNYLNRNGTRYENIKDDGDIGPTTIRVLKEALKHNPPIRLLNVICIQQGAKYLDIMDSDESQEENIGWLDRIFEGIYYDSIFEYERK